MKIKMGTKVRDLASGLEGIAVSRIEYLNGCIQYGVKPGLDKNGKCQETQYIDEGQLKKIGEGIFEKEEKEEEWRPPGGEMPDAPNF